MKKYRGMLVKRPLGLWQHNYILIDGNSNEYKLSVNGDEMSPLLDKFIGKSIEVEGSVRKGLLDVKKIR